MRSVIFSLIKSEKIIRSLSCKNPFCAIVSGLRFAKASEEQIPAAIREETTKRVNCHKNGNLPLFCIEKDTRDGVLYAPFACVLMVYPTGLVRPQSGGKRSKAERYVISNACRVQTKRAVANSNHLKNVNNEQKRASFKYGNLKYLIIAGFIPYANDYYITKLFRSTFAGDMVEEHERTTADLGDSVLTKCAKISLKA